MQITFLFLLVKITLFFGESAANKLIKLILKKNNFYYIEENYNFFTKFKTNSLVLLLPGKGCSWAKATGGCTMCSLYYEANQYSKKVKSNDLIKLYKIAFLLTISAKPFSLIIYNGGSFLNDEEIPADIQLRIIELVSQHPTIKEVLIESRVEYINTERIKLFKKILGNKILKIGIGLESSNNKIRNEYIRKGLKIEDYDKTVNFLKELKVKILTYIFIKPILVSEKEAIEDAIKSTKYAFDRGSDEVALECAFVQPHTKMAALYAEGKYKPPWLWSIIEVIKQIHNFGNIRVGRFIDIPPPIDIPHNCLKCNMIVEEAIENYRLTNNIKNLKDLNCDCKKQWLEELSKS